MTKVEAKKYALQIAWSAIDSAFYHTDNWTLDNAEFMSQDQIDKVVEELSNINHQLWKKRKK